MAPQLLLSSLARLRPAPREPRDAPPSDPLVDKRVALALVSILFVVAMTAAFALMYRLWARPAPAPSPSHARQWQPGWDREAAGRRTREWNAWRKWADAKQRDAAAAASDKEDGSAVPAGGPQVPPRAKTRFPVRVGMGGGAGEGGARRKEMGKIEE